MSNLLYVSNESVFGLAGPLMREKGWNVMPQTRTRYPSKIDGKSIEWKPLQTAQADDATFKIWCREASQDNVACVLGEACGNMFAVDIDCLDAAASNRMHEIATEILGYTELQRVGRAPKIALFYKYDDVAPKNSCNKLVDYEDAQLEIKSQGSLMTLHGLHHKTGQYYTWSDENPFNKSVADVKSVSIEQINDFINAVGKEFKFSNKINNVVSLTNFRETSSDGIIVPLSKMDSKLEDGREEFLKTMSWNIVRRNSLHLLEADRNQVLDDAKSKLITAVIETFQKECELNGKWNLNYLRTESVSKVNRAVGKLLCGEMKPWVEKAAKKEASLESLNDGRPVIHVVLGDMFNIVSQAEKALIDTKAGIYQRGGKLVRVGDDVRFTSDGIGKGRQIISLEESSLAEVLGMSANFVKYDSKKDEYFTVDVPSVVSQTLACRNGFWKLPILSGFITTPTLRKDGSLLMDIGYDDKTGLLLENSGIVWNILENPSKLDAMKSLDLLNDLIKDFPFVSNVDKSVALSAFLTASVRKSLPSAPMHAFTAKAAGSGKSKLADIASIIASGEKAAVIAMGHTEEEMEKRLGAVFLRGDSVVAIDNIERPVCGEFLCQVLTQQSVGVRILGKSEMPTLLTSTMLTATGNNLTFTGDMRRRVVMSQLDAKMERPELRQFDRDPVDVVMQNRKPYVEACLTILRAFVCAGKPNKLSPLGSFEAWSLLVRDALIWLEQSDPVDSIETIRAEDPENSRNVAMLTSLYEVFKGERMTMKDIVNKAMDKSMTDFTIKNPNLFAAVNEIAGQGNSINSKSLGAWMRKNEGRVISEFTLQKGKLIGGFPSWTIAK